MSTATEFLFEYRCTRCWQALYADCSDASKETVCPYCETQFAIPEATAERVERAREVASESLPTLQEQPESETNWTDVDYNELLKRDMQIDTSSPSSLNSLSSTPLKRLIAHLIDGVLLAAAMGLGGMLLIFLASNGYLDLHSLEGNGTRIPKETVFRVGWVAYFPALVLSIFQWCMIAVQGQTVGKKFLGMKIVGGNGQPPGFVQGVILRNWVRVLLSVIPFFALFDACFIFTQSTRCIHDYIANTWVVDNT